MQLNTSIVYKNNALALAVVEFEVLEINGTISGQCAIEWEWEFCEEVPEGWVLAENDGNEVYIKLGAHDINIKGMPSREYSEAREGLFNAFPSACAIAAGLI